jgi:transposase-like protein
MGRPCSICAHPNRDDIDAALISGASYSAVSKQFGVGPESVRRHHDAHLSPALAAMEAAEQEAKQATLLDRIEGLITRAETLYNAASDDGKSAQALNVLREMRGLLELYGKASGEIDSRPQVTVNLMASPEWLVVRGVVFAALQNYPDARAAVAGRLLELEAGS